MNILLVIVLPKHYKPMSDSFESYDKMNHHTCVYLFLKVYAPILLVLAFDGNKDSLSTP